MANELIHSSVGTALSQAEWEDVNAHVCNNSTQGDILYIGSTGLIQRLAIGSSGNVLMSSGGLPTWQAAFLGPSTANRRIESGEVQSTASGPVTINFSVGFSTTPRVVITPYIGWGGTADVTIAILSARSSSGFNFYLCNATGALQTKYVHYIAEGPA